MELVIFLEKKQRILTQMKVVVLEMTSCRIINYFLTERGKIRIQDFIDKTNFFFGTMIFSPWAILAMCLHMRAFQKIYEK